MALFSGLRWPSGVGSVITRAPNWRAASAATSSGVTTVMACSAATADAALMVSTSMASTTPSRVAAENTGASLVLAAVSRLTAITNPDVRGRAGLRAAHVRPSCQAGLQAGIGPG